MVKVYGNSLWILYLRISYVQLFDVIVEWVICWGWILNGKWWIIIVFWFWERYCFLFKI